MAVRPVSYSGFPAAGRATAAAARTRPALPGARWFARDLAIVLGVIGVYFLLRGSAPDRIEFSVAVTNALISFERTAGIFWEPQIQQWSIQSHWVKEFANFVYAYLHFPVLGAVAIWLWFKNRQSFLFMRNVMFVSMVIGLLFYYAFPAAPPRLMELHGHDFGFVDTVFGTETNVNYAQPSLILNEYAAIPSFHFGWIALASAAIWTNTRSYSVRALAIALTVVMTWAIVASANHLFVDMALGGLVVLASWRAAQHFERRKVTRRM